jgi:hypothetical protein
MHALDFSGGQKQVVSPLHLWCVTDTNCGLNAWKF